MRSTVRGAPSKEEFAVSDFDTETKYAWRADVVDPQKQSLGRSSRSL
jgi:hypothetical protein